MKKKALDVKLAELTKYLENTEKVKDLPSDEHERLVRQAGIMTNYSAVLDERISAFN